MLRVRDLMSRTVLSCTPETDLARAGWLLWEGDCGALPVVRDGALVGLITDRDLALTAAMKSRPCIEIRVSEAMSPGDLAVVGPDATLEEALELLERRRVRRLPVVTSEDQRLVGILSISDFIRRTERSPRDRGFRPERLLSALRAIAEERAPATI